VAVTQGGIGGTTGTPGQPATIHGSGSRAVGTPLVVTRGFGTVMIAWPPCTHVTVAPC
jgi:hypothetical protein